jgi:hypothetical protein
MAGGLLTDIWKDRMKECLQMIYHNQLNDKKLDEILDNKVQESLKVDRKVRLRNIYEGITFDVDLNNILNWVYTNNLNIGANGAFSESWRNKPSDVTKLIIGNLDGRAIDKNLAKKYETEGDLKKAATHDILQTKQKQDTNSIYGVMSQMGSFLYSPDSASFITAQSQQLTSEVLWSFEKFIGKNTVISNYNEAFLYLNNILKTKRDFDKYKNYITYYPTFQDVSKRILWLLSDMPNYLIDTHEIEKSLFYFIKGLSEEERLYLFYKNNLKEFILLNPKVQNIFKKVLEKDTLFYNPYQIPEIYKGIIDEICDVLFEFVAHFDMTFDRITKYKTRQRDVIVLSDTDSVFISLHELIEMVKTLCGASINPVTTEEDLLFKLVNTFASICSKFVVKVIDEFLVNSNSEIENPKYNINAKNEFYYQTMLLYKGVKKNYSGYVRMREGNLVPEKKQIVSTGIKLTSSKIPKDVSTFQSNLISKYILKTNNIDQVKILNEINIMRKVLEQGLKEGKKEYGMPVRFAGYDAYKNPDQMQQVRLAEIWNRLYPLDQVLSGDTMLTFETKVFVEDQLYLIKDIEMRETIKNKIYCDKWDGETNLIKRYGIKTVGMPRDGANYKIPSWLIDIIDIEAMINKHLQAIYDLLPSIGINRSKVSSNDYRYSSLISF